MSEIAVRRDEPDYQSAAVARLTEWAHSADAAFNVAEKLVRSSFVPASFKGNPIEATAAILAGLEVGLSPMAALRSFDVIQGQAAPRALTLRAIVQSYGHEIELVESTSTKCRMRGRRRGAQSWQSVLWTIDRAKELGVTGKDNWKKQPAAMLVARATSELCRLIAADAILGVGYSAEEVIDGATGEPDSPTIPEPVETPTRTMSYTPPNDDPEPTLVVVEDEPQPDNASGVKPLTAAQSKMMHALLNETGNGNRETGLAYISHVVGREVETSKDLSRDDASKVIDALQADKDAMEQAFPEPDGVA